MIARYSCAILAAVLMVIPLTSVHAAEEAPACSIDPAFAWLDFWVGEWDVSVQGKPVGTNSIQKILNGCAITEDWLSTNGQRGHSLFYFDASKRVWKQVWVTGSALARGGMKEKTQIERFEDGGIRFQGEIILPGGDSYLDRTTLTLIKENEVRQHIEISLDGGESWQTVFDGLYTRKK